MARKAQPDGSAPHASVYLIHGSDEYLVQEAARRILDALCPKQDRAFGLDEVSAEAATADDAAQCLRQCLVAVRTVGFFQGRKLVWFRHATFLKNGNILKSRQVQSWMSELTALIRSGLPEGHRLLVTAPEVDGRSAFVKACREAGEVQEYAVPSRAYQAMREARDRVRGMLSAAGLRAGESALDLLLNRAGTGTRQLAAEVEKLFLVVGQGGEVTPDAVRAVVSVSRVSEGWDLADAVAARKTVEALTLLRQLLFQKVHWVVLMGGLETRFRDLMVMRECMDRGWVRKADRTAVWAAPQGADELLGALGRGDPRTLHPFRAGILMDQASAFTLQAIEARRRMIMEARERMVSGFAEPEILLEFLVLRLAGRTTGSRSRVRCPQAMVGGREGK